MIVRGTADEAAHLDVCLSYAKDYVDGIFLTFNAPKGEAVHPACFEIAKKYNAVSVVKVWEDNFEEMRNFSFSQVPKKYDYILWLDADDALRNGDVMRSVVLANKKDCYSMWYQYDFDEYKRPYIVHQNVRVVKNDGTFLWKGVLHESITSNRDVKPWLIKGADVLHLSDTKRFEENKVRNLRIALKQRDENPKDPRSYYNTGNAYVGNSQYDKALEEFSVFKMTTQSGEERYIAHLRCAEANWHLGKRFQALDELRFAIGLKPWYPDAYVKMGMMLVNMKRYEEAVQYLGLSLQFKPPYHSIVVYNPREYDFEPINLLGIAYFEMNKMEDSLKYFELCLKIYPKDERLISLVEDLRTKVAQNKEMQALAEELRALSLPKFKARIETLKPQERSHPEICHVINTRIIKKKSSGKEVVIFCGYTAHEWTPKVQEETGVGGSEEAVIELAKRWKKAGYDVTVFNSCGYKEQEYDGVVYKPFWMWNYRDKIDTLILWRHPIMAQHAPNAKRVIVDMHDVLSEAEFTQDRLEHIDYVCVKTEAHADCFPSIPKEKIRILPNGIEPPSDEKVEKSPMLIINTSSADRSLSAALDIFEKVKKEVPEARMVWAYGWETFDAVNSERKEQMEWKATMQKRMKELGVNEAGRLNKEEIISLYKEGAIFLYPTEFYEIFCISAVKAQLYGAFPICTDFAALNEVVHWGDVVHSKKTIKDWSAPYQFDFAAVSLVDIFAEKVILRLKGGVVQIPDIVRENIINDYSWDRVSDEWTKLFT